MKRYIVRKEYFGALVYDNLQNDFIAFDEQSFELLNALNRSMKDGIEDSDIEFLKENGFLKNDGTPDYDIVVNDDVADALSAPTRIHLLYTEKCNLNCRHCFTKKEAGGDELSFAEKVAAMRTLRAHGVNEVLIGGGEPFAQSDFPDFVEQCLELGFAVKVFTNGLLLTDETIERISKWKLCYLSVSIDGATSDAYKEIRGADKLNHLVEVMKKLSEKCPYPILMSLTVGKSNRDNLEGYLKIAEETKVQRIKIRPIKPSGNVYLNRELFISADEYFEFMVDLQRIWNKKYKNKFGLDYSWGDARIQYDAKKSQLKVVSTPFPYVGYGCAAGKSSIVISANGDVNPCGFLKEYFGAAKPENNLRNRDVMNIWKSGGEFHCLRNMQGNSECLECEYYDVCHGGCMARNVFAGKQIDGVDPWCLRKYFPVKIK